MPPSMVSSALMGGEVQCFELMERSRIRPGESRRMLNRQGTPNMIDS
jgi:hypothetical protein